jgi:hypothetical protein
MGHRSSITSSLPPRLRSLRPLTPRPPRNTSSSSPGRKVRKMQVYRATVACVPLPPPPRSPVRVLLRLALLKGVAEPVEPLVEAVARGRTRGLDVPE